MPNTEFAKFLDTLRESRNLTRKDFIKDIVSERQYYRFIKGESALSSDIITMLMERLEVNSSKMIKVYQKGTNQIYDKLLDAYDYLHQNKYKDSLELINMIEYDQLSNELERKTYEIVDIISNAGLGKLPHSLAIKRTKKLINYPEILKKTTLNYVEAVGLNFISAKLISEGDSRVAQYSYDRLMKKEYLYDTLTNLLFYTSAAKNLGTIGEYTKALEVTQKGIKEFKQHQSLNILEGLFYLQALAYKDMKQIDMMKKSLSRLFAQLYAEGNSARFEQYEALVTKNFGINISDVIEFKV